MKPAEPAIKALGRQALHAAVLGFTHPLNGELVRFESEPPPDLRELHNSLIRSFS